MIPNKIRGSRRIKAQKFPKNIERLFREGKCRECSVVVTRMDFAKILGKFTKVKIQYESSTTPKTKPNSRSNVRVASPNSIARLKSNENGMVLIHRNASVPNISSKKIKVESPRFTPNILKENNRMLKRTIVKDKISDNKNNNVLQTTLNLKQYGIVFEDPLVHNNNNDVICKISLSDLLSHINDSILPSEDWCIDFFPKKGELKDDKVYDRIAAELEDLMYNEKPKSNNKTGTVETKVDEFPSIMDILNDSNNDHKTSDQSGCLVLKSNLESSDVEAMLLGKPNTADVAAAPTPMDVDNVGNLIEDVNQLANIHEDVMPESTNKLPAVDMKCEEIENPQSPSILDEALQKGIEEHLPRNPDKAAEESILKIEDKIDASQESETDKNEEKSIVNNEIKLKDIESKVTETPIDEINKTKDAKINQTASWASLEGITHLVFKKTKDGGCSKTVTCPKNLKYDIEIDGKSVEFIGAPKFISSLEDLQVLLQIVNDSELDSLYVLH